MVEQDVAMICKVSRLRMHHSPGARRNFLLCIVGAGLSGVLQRGTVENGCDWVAGSGQVV
jgi:hypothetical protein